MAKSEATLPVIFLMGPTATGKTGLAVELHRRLPVEIVSVDSAMVYRGLDIGTAKPAAEIQRIAPHRLIDICEPTEAYSAARFCRDAMTEIGKIHALGRIPLLVGGTGLYFRALEHGLSELPGADPDVRARLETEAAQAGWDVLHARLAAVDPRAAGRIHPNDPQRIQRALEVYELTGKPLSDHFLAESPVALPFAVIKIIVSPAERQDLHVKIDRRFHAMLGQGLVDEVTGLRKRGDLHAGLPAMRMVGYRQVWKYLGGELDYQTMIDHAIVATRQLAKRQMTWLRKERKAQWFDSERRDSSANLLKFIENNTGKGL